MRRLAMGLALAAGLALTACGTNPAPTPRPVPAPVSTPAHTVTPTTAAERYDATSIEGSMRGHKLDNGLTISSVTCVPIPGAVDANGLGDYQCVTGYDDGSQINQKVTQQAGGNIHMSGIDTPVPAAPTTTAPASFTASGLAAHLMSPEFNKGQAVTIVQAHCTPLSVDSNGVGTYSCDYTTSDGGLKNGATIAVDQSGNITAP